MLLKDFPYHSVATNISNPIHSELSTLRDYMVEPRFADLYITHMYAMFTDFSMQSSQTDSATELEVPLYCQH